ncbi:MAG: NADH-quinone oxidoreductase subunit C, partial [Hoeflea sp.]
MSEALKDLSDYLVEIRGNLIESAEIAFGELTLVAQPANLVELMTFLRDDAQCQFVNFIDCCGVDWPGRAERFDVV